MDIRRVEQVEVVGPHSLRLVFNDGSARRVNLLPLLQGPIFEPLRDPAYFGRRVSKIGVVHLEYAVRHSAA